MQVSVENVGKLERKLTVRIPAGDYEVAGQDAPGRSRPQCAPEGLSSRQDAAQGDRAALRLAGSRRSDFRIDPHEFPGSRRAAEHAPGDGSGNQHDRRAGRRPYRIHRDVRSAAGSRRRSTSAASRSTSRSPQVADVDVDTMIETLRQQRRSWSAGRARARRTATWCCSSIPRRPATCAIRPKASIARERFSVPVR